MTGTRLVRPTLAELLEYVTALSGVGPPTMCSRKRWRASN